MGLVPPNSLGLGLEHDGVPGDVCDREVVLRYEGVAGGQLVVLGLHPGGVKGGILGGEMGLVSFEIPVAVQCPSGDPGGVKDGDSG